MPRSSVFSFAVLVDGIVDCHALDSAQLPTQVEDEGFLVQTQLDLSCWLEVKLG